MPLLCAAALFAPATSVHANPASTHAQEESDLLSFGVSYFDIGDDDEAADFRLEYRWADPVFWDVKPFAGVEATSDGAIYGLGGLLVDWRVAEDWIVTPSLAVGLYHEGDEGKDLGHVIEFRSQLELAYVLSDESRISAAYNHISNASLGDDNPGAEALGLYYHLPLSRLF